MNLFFLIKLVQAPCYGTTNITTQEEGRYLVIFHFKPILHFEHVIVFRKLQDVHIFFSIFLGKHCLVLQNSCGAFRNLRPGQFTSVILHVIRSFLPLDRFICYRRVGFLLDFMFQFFFHDFFE